MPISLTKTLAEVGEFEGAVTIRILGAEDNEKAYTNIDDLIDYLDSVMTVPLGKKLDMPNLSKGVSDVIFSTKDMKAPMGAAVLLKVQPIPAEHRSKFLGGVAYVLNQLGIKTLNWEVHEHYGDVVIPIANWGSPKHQKTSRIYLTATTFEKIANLLGYNLTHAAIENKWFVHQFKVDDLRTRISDYFLEVEKALAPKPTKNILRFMEALFKLAHQALNYGYDTIEAFNSTLLGK